MPKITQEYYGVECVESRCERCGMSLLTLTTKVGIEGGKMWRGRERKEDDMGFRPLYIDKTEHVFCSRNIIVVMEVMVL